MRPLSMLFGFRLPLALALLASACQHDSNADFDDAHLPSGSGAAPSSGGSAPEPGVSGAADEAGNASGGTSAEAGNGGTGGKPSGAGAGGKPAAEGGKAGQAAGGANQGGMGMAGKGGGGMAGSGGKPEPDPEPVTVQLRDFEDATIFSCDVSQNDGEGPNLQTDHDWQCSTEALIEPVLSDIPAGAQIGKATLSLVCVNPGGGSVAVSLATTKKWSEATVKYSNRPSVGELIQNVTCAKNGDVISIDLTDTVTAWLGGQVDPLGIYLTTEASDGTDFASTEAGKADDRPVLEVTYTPPKK